MQMVGVHGRAAGFVLLASALSAGFVAQSLAEGRCPPGQYPIGGQGVRGCAPMPGGGAGSNGVSPRPTGRWETRWGALLKTRPPVLVHLSPRGRLFPKSQSALLRHLRWMSAENRAGTSARFVSLTTTNALR